MEGEKHYGSPICHFLDKIFHFVIHFIIVIVLYYVPVNSNAIKEVPLDDKVDKLLNNGGEVTGMGLRGKRLDFMCDMDAPHLSVGKSNSCCYLTIPMPSPAPSLLSREEHVLIASPPHTLAP
jgi:hypothetical protein